MHQPEVGHRSRRGERGSSLPARFAAALAATAVVFLAAPLVPEAAAPGELPGWTAAPSASFAPIARADERVPHPSTLRSLGVGLAGAALPASERRLAESKQRAAASLRSCGALQRWLLCHATATSLS